MNSIQALKKMERSLGNKGSLLIESGDGGVFQFGVVISDVDIKGNQLTVNVTSIGN